MAWPIARQINDIDQRRADRKEIGVPTLFRRRSPPITPPESATLLNLSRLGFLVRTDLLIIDGEFVSIELPMLGEMKARSVWSMGYDVGAEFLVPIPTLQYENVLAVIERHQEAVQPERSSSTPESLSNR
ncbi:hypothetical protein [Sphingomonas cavernae]|uniref:PilZ domain-containing protein n=1 Tax=Sphingomonas cavernae TaxID=2320861 RepID=A0A418WMS1_9SPHN|nr:hypothetical protein [Sphingomonas cavernae]RJF91309.1 hypothetical protein D3876_14480 [Sphingomonas cavernae]